MNTVSIRQKLHQYINVADDSKLRSIFRMIEGEFAQKTEWWEDSEFIAKLDSISNNLKNGTDKGFVWEELKKELLEDKAI